MSQREYKCPECYKYVNGLHVCVNSTLRDGGDVFVLPQRPVPPELWQQFNSRCRSHNITPDTGLIEAIRDWLDKTREALPHPYVGYIKLKRGYNMEEKKVCINDRVRPLVEGYQCPGCMCGSDTECYEKGDNLECGKHAVGTSIMGVGRIFLGLPKGFNREGPINGLKVYIFESPKEGWGYDKFNVPVWKYLDEHGNTLVRGLSPRINWPFLHIFIGDHRGEIDCIELTKTDLSEMD